jgi:hypothetical protein
MSALPIITFSFEGSMLFDNYECLAQSQGTKLAMVHVRTSKGRKRFKLLIFDQVTNQFNDYGKRTSPDFP